MSRHNNKEEENIDELMKNYLACKSEKERRYYHIKITENGMKQLVKHLATPIAIQTGVAFEDLVQVGALGLIKAIDCYESDRNAKFSTYATYYIKGELRHYVRDKAALIKTPRKVQELIVKVYNTAKELAANGNNEPSFKEIAASINVPPEKVEEVMKIDKYKFMVSLDQTITSDEEDSTLLERIPSENYQDYEDSYENKLLIETAIKQLPDEYRQLIELSFFEELNQREIAEKLGLSQMQVSRRLKKALNQMYNIIRRS
ncbi:sigma-70 family RNA polymerase sigma factor [bacterium]|nr:sigma-70 family RNA polymerase sigma factor [bacterium]